MLFMANEARIQALIIRDCCKYLHNSMCIGFDENR